MRALAEVEWIDMMELARPLLHPSREPVTHRAAPRRARACCAGAPMRAMPGARRSTLTAKGRAVFWNVWVESERIYGALADELGACESARIAAHTRCADRDIGRRRRHGSGQQPRLVVDSHFDPVAAGILRMLELKKTTSSFRFSSGVWICIRFKACGTSGANVKSTPLALHCGKAARVGKRGLAIRALPAKFAPVSNGVTRRHGE